MEVFGERIGMGKPVFECEMHSWAAASAAPASLNVLQRVQSGR